MTNRRSARLVYNVTAAVALALLSTACANSYNRSGPQQSDVPVGEQQDQHASMLHRYCRKMRDTKDLYVAASMCRRAFDVDPTDTTPLYTLAEIYGEMGAIESKAEAYRMALRVTPDEEEAIYGLAKTSIDLGQYEIAVAQLERAIQLSPDDPRYYNAMGIAKDQMNEHETAQALYRAGLAIDSDNVSLRNNLGLSLSLSGDHDASVAMLRDVARNPEAGAIGSRNLAHAATSAAQLQIDMAEAKSVPMEIVSAPEPEYDNAAMAGPEHMAFMDALENGAEMTTAEAQPETGTMEAGAADAGAMEAETMEDGAMVAAMSKPITALEGGEAEVMERENAKAAKGPRSLGTASGTTAGSGSDQEVAARMPAQAFSGQGNAAEGSVAVPSPEKIMSNLEKAGNVSAAAGQSANAGAISYTVQIGSYKSQKGAERGWKILSGSATDLLGELPHTIVETDLGGEKGTFYRLRAGDLASKGPADTLCASLSDRDIGCYVVRLPETPSAPVAAADAMAKPGGQDEEIEIQPAESSAAAGQSTEG